MSRPNCRSGTRPRRDPRDAVGVRTGLMCCEAGRVATPHTFSSALTLADLYTPSGSTIVAWHGPRTHPSNSSERSRESDPHAPIRLRPARNGSAAAPLRPTGPVDAGRNQRRRDESGPLPRERPIRDRGQVRTGRTRRRRAKVSPLSRWTAARRVDRNVPVFLGMETPAVSMIVVAEDVRRRDRFRSAGR